MFIVIRSCWMSHAGRISWFFDDCEAPEDEISRIFLGFSEIVDFGYCYIFWTILRGPFGIHQNTRTFLFWKDRGVCIDCAGPAHCKSCIDAIIGVVRSMQAIDRWGLDALLRLTMTRSESLDNLTARDMVKTAKFFCERGKWKLSDADGFEGASEPSAPDNF